MNIAKTISNGIANTGRSLKSIAKMLVESRCAHISAIKDCERPLIILGNGPSLNQTIEDYATILQNNDTLAVNFAANAPQFTMLKPRYYVLADPHFFQSADDENVSRLMNNLSQVCWQMTLFIPAKQRRAIDKRITDNANITVNTFNPVGVEGWHWLENLAYSKNWGMPRPRNVLIPSIMLGIAMGYIHIYICGADHSWMRTLSVNENNEVVSVQPHFYKDNKKEQTRTINEYRNYHLHDIVYSFYIAFRSYFDIRRYADTRCVNIYNSTPDSFIDAFPRRSISTLS